MHAFDAYAALAVERAGTGGRAMPASSEGETAPPDARQPEPAPAPAASSDAARDEPPAAAPSPVTEPEPAATVSQAEHVPPFGQTLLRRRSHTGAWIAANIVLVLALALQIAYAYRSEVLARYPASRPMLTAFCDAADCSLALPQRPDLVKIEASDVHMVDANRPALVQLTATLRSYASYDLAYPALDLVLTNANEHALARRIFTPQEYLGTTRDAKSGIPPNAEITVALELDTGDLNAAGFRLDLLAAPAL